mgnify:CR=1 FL=1
MQADPDKWDDSELIAAVSRGLENLDAGAAAEANPNRHRGDRSRCARSPTIPTFAPTNIR